jgi:heme exporter protein B
MRFWHQTAALMRAQARSEARSGEVLLVVLPFGAAALLVIPMAVGTDSALLERVGPGLFWVVALLFGIVVTQRSTAHPSGARSDLLRMLAVDPAARFAATTLVSGALLVVFEVVIGMVVIVLYDPVLTGWAWLALVVPLSAAGLALVGTLAGSIARGTGVRTTLVPLLVLPVAIPVLLAAAQATEGLRLGTGILRWVLLLAITDLVLAIAGVLTARPLEESES